MATWGYEGELGAANWGKLCPEYAIADEGKAQSPIDLPGEAKETTAESASSDPTAEQAAKAEPAKLELKSGKASIINNGLTVMVNAKGASEFKVQGRVYELAQFHFHSPAEHTFGGQRHELELHLVHFAKDGQGPGPAAAVVGIHYKLGETADPFLKRVFEHVPSLTKNEETPLAEPIAFDDIDIAGEFFEYDGSLTTPPCSEGIHWCVMKKVLTLSKEQLEVFRTAIPVDNYRPVQPLNGRSIAVIQCSCTSHSAASEAPVKASPAGATMASKATASVPHVNSPSTISA
ncbi:Carbonic anhydrase [Hondaea fermentalgiana]|uniref:carbonic anhydrase n=1 Tax=Hondaea fermentalgiana TaxID=2315210 RepID=A0A2R5GEA3_9STRA|nr:Carbonic anhydrase [Hondaea fermentalgiana]|eukprot:GBG29270.1 Carbonic anhydrase [Hondaea fermentalgiana]